MPLVAACDAVAWPPRATATEVWDVADMSRQTPRTAASAACASDVAAAKNALDWPLNSPVEVRNLTAAIAPPFAGSVGRMIEQSGRLGAMNSHGCGKMLFARVE